jgi:hypothetical protein
MTETLLKTGMGALLLASVPVGGDPTIWAQWGLAGMVVAYTLWRDSVRERRMAEALERHQTWTQATLLSALERNTAALEKMAAKIAPKGSRE